MSWSTPVRKVTPWLKEQEHGDLEPNNKRLGALLGLKAVRFGASNAVL
jgi:hypothetical protein